MSAAPASPLPVSEASFSQAVRSERVAAALGITLGIAFTICFVTGVISHLVQEPPGWFSWPSRPAGLYRITQGLHVTTGIASIPLLLAKLWVVYPKLFAWPPVRSAAHAIERLALLPLIGGSLLLLTTGLANINIWRPWAFSFRAGHNAGAWIVMGALVIHVMAKRAVTINALRPTRGSEAARATTPAVGLDRRGFVATIAAASALLVVVTVGQAYSPLRKLALLTPRRPDAGPQGFPVNRTAASVQLERVDLAQYRLVVDGPGAPHPLSLSYRDLQAMSQHEAELPIACVEGWSTSQRWAGVRVRDLLDLAGATPGAEVVAHSMQASRRQQTAPVSTEHSRDRDTLIALTVNGEVLHPDHGFPARLIGPNRPGVHQTKWVARLEVRS